jgi:hypothetical protein
MDSSMGCAWRSSVAEVATVCESLHLQPISEACEASARFIVVAMQESSCSRPPTPMIRPRRRQLGPAGLHHHRQLWVPDCDGSGRGWWWSRCPPTPPELDPVEPLWSSLKGVELANLAGEGPRRGHRGGRAVPCDAWRLPGGRSDSNVTGNGANFLSIDGDVAFSVQSG